MYKPVTLLSTVPKQFTCTNPIEINRNQEQNRNTIILFLRCNQRHTNVIDIRVYLKVNSKVLCRPGVLRHQYLFRYCNFQNRATKSQKTIRVYLAEPIQGLDLLVTDERTIGC